MNLLHIACFHSIVSCLRCTTKKNSWRGILIYIQISTPNSLSLLISDRNVFTGFPNHCLKSNQDIYAINNFFLQHSHLPGLIYLHLSIFSPHLRVEAVGGLVSERTRTDMGGSLCDVTAWQEGSRGYLRASTWKASICPSLPHLQGRMATIPFEVGPA